jgi:hypothetical protein
VEGVRRVVVDEVWKFGVRVYDRESEGEELGGVFV